MSSRNWKTATIEVATRAENCISIVLESYSSHEEDPCCNHNNLVACICTLTKEQELIYCAPRRRSCQKRKWITCSLLLQCIWSFIHKIHTLAVGLNLRMHFVEFKM